MSDPVLITIIGSVQAIALAVIAAWLKTAQEQQDKNHAETKSGIVAAQDGIEGVRKEVNGKMDNLLQTTAESERAKGILEGRAAEGSERDLAIKTKADIIAATVVPSLVEQLPERIAERIIPQLKPTARKKEPGQ